MPRHLPPARIAVAALAEAHVGPTHRDAMQYHEAATSLAEAIRAYGLNEQEASSEQEEESADSC